MDNVLEQMTELLAAYADYIKHFVPDSREKDNAITKLEESVFWITYLNGDENYE